ncbi:glutathione S-transferase family protein [Qipengyuania sp. DY56-A-20]|jgi:glutathione S-transferase|uniref:Glutathione S-transferase family protein n=1 Tax=Qipengyuania benthica TaxID=3067651 RepID=A0ABT9H9I1_9SPHN|nr:glutathione S-transferase family protein [Qipengyuania sp. DY56-A-20]MDP4539974.1 glutathione S-transferase family protein [Qipengyuania sp. DY56-A-20]
MATIPKLYGLPHSLYTGKVRSYLRKQGIAYRETAPSDPHFTQTLVPKIGRVIIPVLELADGAVVQDTVDIIDHFEQAGVRYPAYPETKRQRAVAHLFELYSVVSLTRHAMHYRWSYLAEQEAFLRDAFSAGGDPERTASTMARMSSYLPMLGVSQETIPAIEESYHQLLAGLEAHFAAYPYLLGSQPSIGDYSLFGPLFAHLGRDPVPLAIMQREAPKVFRWVERMHAPDLDLVEYGQTGGEGGFAPGDRIPASLDPVLDQIAAELLPGLTDQLEVMCAHVASGAAQPGQPVTAKPHQRIIGQTETSFRGIPYTGGVQPYTFFLWQRLREAADGSDAVHELFTRHRLSPLLDSQLPIRVERADNIEKWGAFTN